MSEKKHPWRTGDLYRFHDIPQLQKAQAESLTKESFWHSAWIVVLNTEIDDWKYEYVYFFSLDYNEVRRERTDIFREVYRLASRLGSAKTDLAGGSHADQADPDR